MMDRRPLPEEGGVRRYVLTSAQNNTHVDEAVWLNVMAVAAHYGAELLVGTYSYNKASHGRKSTKRGKGPTGEDLADLWYDPQVLEHVCDERVQLAPGLVWCGDSNIIPTNQNPLSGLEAFNGRASNLVPHAKFAMASVGALGGEATKHNYTTGTVTKANYIQRKAGQLAEQYHGLGALLVEVLDDGSWFVRQLQAAEDGSLRDFHLKAQGGRVTGGHSVSAVTWGDVHVRVVDPMVRDLAWGEGGMLDALKPRVQMLHDLIDFRARNHHEAKDPHATFRKWQDRADSVSAEVEEVVQFLATEATRSWCQTVVVPSNHHEAFARWLREADWRTDPANARIYLEANLALLDGAEDVFEWACRRSPAMPFGVTFLRDDESFVVAGNELGQHGHMGHNGARGNHRAFAKLGRPATTGHEHTAGIHLGNWVAGTSTRLRIGYNRGPSSWSHSHVVQYPEGTRTLVTMWRGRWRA